MRKLITYGLALAIVTFVVAGFAGLASANHSLACGNEGPNGGDQVFVGTDHDDCIRGGNGDDTLYGLEGNDRLGGNHGKDTLYGGPDNDRLFGGRGKDVIDGGDGFDRCFSAGRGDNDTFIDCEVIEEQRR